MRPTTAASCASRFSAAGSHRVAPRGRPAPTGISSSLNGRASSQRPSAEADDAAVDEHPHQLFREERIAVGQLHDALPSAAGRPPEQASTSRAFSAAPSGSSTIVAALASRRPT